MHMKYQKSHGIIVSKGLKNSGNSFGKNLIGIQGKKILQFSLVLRTSIPKSLLVLLQNNAGHSRKYNLTLYFFTCPSDIG